MTTLRALYLAVLCFAVLPWGAFARHYEVPVRAAVTASAQSVERVSRPCRGAALPGTHCAPDAMLGAAVGIVAPFASTTERPPNTRRSDIYHPQRPLDPPKPKG